MEDFKENSPDLTALRGQIDAIDDQLLTLFSERMKLTNAVGVYKKEHHLPVLQSNREAEILQKVREKAPEGLKDDAALFFTELMAISKAGQNRLLAPDFDFFLPPAEANLKKDAAVACQGVAGAYSQIAAETIFPSPSVSFFSSFEEVFEAIEKVICEYGVLPIENSSAGSVQQIYRLLERFGFFISASAKIPVCHALLAKKGVSFEEITTVVSHEQALQQSAGFFRKHPDICPQIFSNTAAAAKFAAESLERNIAALASPKCAELYGLQILNSCVQDYRTNFTRFVCVSRSPVREAQADRISLILRTQHRAGALFEILAEFAARKINLLKLQSRPIPETDFESTFYFDFEGALGQEKTDSLLRVLKEKTVFFQFLGNYREYIG